jgi:hypothetical protein
MIAQGPEDGFDEIPVAEQGDVSHLYLTRPPFEAVVVPATIDGKPPDLNDPFPPPLGEVRGEAYQFLPGPVPVAEVRAAARLAITGGGGHEAQRQAAVPDAGDRLRR